MNVAVIGAGVIGCAVACELAARGARVRVFDMRGAGQGATRATAGMLAPHIEGHHEQLLRLATCGLSLYDDFIDRLSEWSGQRIEYRRTGTLQVPQSDERRAELGETAARLAAHGIPHEWRGAALFIPAHGYVRVPHLMTALEAAAVRLGVEFSTKRVEKPEPAPLGAEVAVIAAGSWSGPLTGAPVRPIKGQTVELHTPSALPDHIVWGDRCYVVPWQDGSAIVGATAEDAGFDERIDEAARDRLVASACELVPALSSAEIRETRVGLRPATPDELPVIGRSATMRGVVYATGHYRNGILLAPLTAALVADLVCPTAGTEAPSQRESALLSLVRPDRFNL